MSTSIKFELSLPIRLFHKLRLLALIEHTRLEHQVIHLGPHEATITVLRRADDWLATHIETGIDNHRTAGAPAKRFYDFPIERIRFTPDSLNPRRVINVSDRWNFGPRNVQLFDPPKLLFGIAQLAPVLT